MTALSVGFRPFFLLGPAYGALVVAWWVMALGGARWPPLPAAPAEWHAHEMLFGFVAAAVAGFILTAVAAFTGRPAIRGAPLAALVVLWLAGRVAMGLGGAAPGHVVAVVDLAFPVALVATVTRELWLAGNHRNLPIAALLALLAGSDALFHAARLGMAGLAPGTALLAGIHVVLLLLTLIAGRVVPSFTANWLRARGASTLPVRRPAIEVAVVALTAATGAAHAGGAGGGAVAVLTACCAAAHGARLAGWRGLATRGEPLLFVLHAGYAWLVAGYALLALAAAAPAVPAAAGVHALTVGAMGTMILAMMSRVALGHTGRALRARRPIVAAYVLVGLSALSRIGAALAPLVFLPLILASAVLWATAFGLYLAVYAPILCGPRVEPAVAAPGGAA